MHKRVIVQVVNHSKVLLIIKEVDKRKASGVW